MNNFNCSNIFFSASRNIFKDCCFMGSFCCFDFLLLNLFNKTIIAIPFRMFLLFLLLICSCNSANASQTERQQLFEPLFDAPCARYQVPKILALAIAKQESGYHPWILNISGKDIRPKSKNESLRYAQLALRSGRSFDVGIMQINSYWIKKHGWPLEQVLDPATNVRIGVWILAQEIRRHGLNWKAVAYYHTPLHKNPVRGRAYALSVVGHVKKILGDWQNGK